MYRRPYVPPVPAAAAPPATPPPDPPVISRHPLPDDGAGAIGRFVVQVFLVATVAVVLVRLLGQVVPRGTVLLLAGSGLLLLAATLLKWVWTGRTARVPLLTVLTLVACAPCILGSVTGASFSVIGVSLPLTLVTLVFALGVLSLAVRFAWWTDGATAALDSRATAALAGGALLLAAVAAVPPSSGAIRVLVVVTLVANEVFGLAVTFTYVGYVLANPAHPRNSIAAAAARWRRILWCREPGVTSPFIQAGVICGFVLVVVIFLPQGPLAAVGLVPPTEPAGSGADVADTILWWHLGFLGVTVVLMLPLAVCGWRDRRPIGRAVAVWMLYGGGDPLPGVYRPSGWLASVRARQFALAVLVFANVALVRTAFADADAALVTNLVRILRFLDEHPGTERRAAVLLLLNYAFTFLLPLLLPVITVILGHGQVLRAMHDQLEETKPTDLYPAKEK